MGHSPKEKPNKTHQVQPKWTRQRNPLSPVDHEYLSHLLPSINWWSSQKLKDNIQDIQIRKGKLEPKDVLPYNQIYFHSQYCIHHPSMLWPSKTIHSDSTRLIRIHITWLDSVDACTCGGYLYSPPSYVLQVLQWTNSLTHKVSP